MNDALDDLAYKPNMIFHRLFGGPKEKKRLLVVGTGWGAMSFLRKLDPSVYDITIVSPRNFFFYTPMLAGVATGALMSPSIIEPVRQTPPMPDATFLRGYCTDVNFKDRTVKVEESYGEMTLPYDHLVLAIGSEANHFGTPGVEKHGVFMKELEHATCARKRMLNNFEQAEALRLKGDFEAMRRKLSFVIVGGGPTGVEFTSELADFVRKDVKRYFPSIQPEIRISILESQPRVLKMFDKGIGEYVGEHLKSLGVDIRTGVRVVKAEEGKVTMQVKADKSLHDVDCGLLVWAGGIGTRPVTKKICESIGAEQQDKRGLVVDEFLRVKGTPAGEVFAMGDCAVSGFAPTAQVASQQGRYLGRVFRDEMAVPKLPFDYTHKGTIAYIGGGEAAASIPAPTKVAHVTNNVLFRQLYNDVHRTDDEGKGGSTIDALGLGGFAIWKSVYFSQLFSYRNRFNVCSDYIRTFFFGRNVAISRQGWLERS